MTLARGSWRHTILRAYWDGQEQPSIESPAGDFFACGWEKYAQVSSLAVCVNPGRAFNCYWEMPFRTRARFTLENKAEEPIYVYYQINYALTDVPDDVAYFHAQFRRTNPLPYKEVYTILDGVAGRGHYVGTYMAWGVNNTGWWGEGEIKFFMDGDGDFPTICGTGTEDYFCGAYNFDPGSVDRSRPSAYQEFTTPYAGMPQVIRPDGVYQLAAALRHVPLAHHGPDPLRAGPAGHDPGARLAHRQGSALPAAAGRHCLGRLLVPDAADRAVPAAARQRHAGGDLTCIQSERG